MCDEDKIKHLEFIENTIARMSEKSSQCKEFSVAVMVVLLGFFVGTIKETLFTGNIFFILLTIIPLLIFGYLDTRYLQQERKYTELYSLVKDDNSNVKKWDMNTKNIDVPRTRFWSVVASWSVGWFYIPIIVLMILLSMFIYVGNSFSKGGNMAVKETEITIYLKMEAPPIGDVIGLVVTWKDDEHYWGEVYFAKENAQDEIFKFWEHISIKDMTHLNLCDDFLKNDLFYRMKMEHRTKNLQPASSNTEQQYQFLYDENRFPWQTYSENEIYQFINIYETFFEKINELTKNENLKEKINLTRTIRSMIKTEAINN